MNPLEEKKNIEAIIIKAWEDENFKNELIKDPKRTIEKFLSIKLNIPTDKKIIVTDQTLKDYVYINIPIKSENDDFELNDEQLDQVAGGTQQDPPIFIKP